MPAGAANMVRLIRTRRAFHLLILCTGDLVHFTLHGRSMVIVNSPHVAFDMLDKKGTIYSDRANRAMHELSTLD